MVKKKYSDNYSRIEHVNFSSIKNKIKKLKLKQR